MKPSGIFITLLFILLWPMFSYSQVSGNVIRLPAHKILPMRDSAGKVLWTRITNNSNFPDTLYPLYNGKTGSENKYRSDRSLINWLIAQVPGSVLKSNDTDKIKLALIYACAPLTKGDTKLSTTNIFNENKCDYPDSAFARKYSIIGSQLAIFHDHCGDQVRFQQEILVATGYFKYSDFFTAALGWHTTCAVLYKGDTIAVDFANNQPFFLIKNPAKHSGYASPQDLHDDTLLITAAQAWRYVNDSGDTITKNLRPGAVSQYRQTYAYKTPRLRRPGRTRDATYTMENKWVMPPHSTVMWADTFYYVIDSTGSAAVNYAINRSVEKAYTYAKMKIMTRDAGYADSVNQAITNSVAQIAGTDFNTAQSILLNDKLTLYSNLPGWRPAKVMTVPQFHVSMVTDTGFIVFGKDAYFGAGLVTGQHLKNKSADTRICYNLWDSKLEEVPVVSTYKQIIYPINNEIFVPPASTLDMDISYNPAIIDFYNGPSFWASNPKALKIEASNDAIAKSRKGRHK